jgi:predicted TIM-barrel fold metal-dependent hydrolase
LPIPPDAWDTQFHVFGPQDRYPYAANRHYTPPTATLEDYFRLLAHLGIERGVCVHPNTHGSDNAVTLNAVRRGEGRVVGVVKLDAAATLPMLREMHRQGVRGIRFAFNPQHGGTFDERLFARSAGWAGELGWSVAIHCAPQALAPLAELLARAPCSIVIDHMGRVDPAGGLDQAPVRALLDLAALPHIWVRLSGADRITRSGPPYADVVPLARSLITAAPERMIWGTDWPHSGYFDEHQMPDDTDLLELLGACATPEQVRRILVENPARLFGN